MTDHTVRRPRLATRLIGRVIPGISRVREQAPVFAEAWRLANETAADTDGPLWVALGDSMSQGLGARSINGGWVGQLHRQMLAEGHHHRLVNLSVTGARVRDILDHQIPVMRALSSAPALVTLLIGANDMFPRSRWEDAVAAYPHVLAELPDKSTVVATLPRRNRAANAMNAAIDGAARSRPIRVLDMRGTLTVRSLIGTTSQDLFHPNERGYANIARRFSETIDRSLF